MSAKTRTPYPTALRVAQRLAAALAPVSTRVEIAGSVRRRRPECGDIEIVVEVPVLQEGLFGDEKIPQVEPIRAALRAHGSLGKNGDRQIELLDVDGSGIKADVFLVHPPAEWGTILAIRTGPADLGRWAVTRMRRLSRRCTQGHVETEAGERIPTPTEADFFAAAGLDCLPPERRDSAEAKWPVEVAR